MQYHLHRWSVVGDYGIAPEARHIRLCGFRNTEERMVFTSAVVEANGRSITTESGSVYILEDIDPDYLLMLRDNNIPYDPENPIRIISK